MLTPADIEHINAVVDAMPPMPDDALDRIGALLISVPDAPEGSRHDGGDFRDG